jgi:predicted TIM-barrel fold metal-dependent hydrolase
MSEHEREPRYTVISADGHAGAPVAAYREYLASQWYDDFDAWAQSYSNPFEDLAGRNAYRNWESGTRVTELEADGIVAEVLFPNTIPPFFPSGALVTPPPNASEYAHRWAGLQAHNRWLADFCADVPGRRAGIAQILLNDVDDACAEVEFVKDAGLIGGILLPGVPPNHEIAPLWSDVYEPLWTLCEEHDIVVNHHSGGGLPAFDTSDPAARAVMLVEIPIYAHRALWALIFAGVFERHPNLKFVLTEQGTGWVPGTLNNLDWFMKRMRIPTAAESHFGGAAVEKLSLTPTEYFRRNCWVGASFLRPVESELRHEVGVDRIMWGSDYPHAEGSYPYSREALRAAFALAPESEIRRMCAETAATVYGFDLALLDPIAAHVGPTVAEIAEPLLEFPADSTCNAFDPDAIVRTW